MIFEMKNQTYCASLYFIDSNFKPIWIENVIVQIDNI